MSRLDRLTEYRIRKGYKTAKAFAAYLGVSQSQISEIDKKEKPANLLLALSEKTDLNLNWLETGKGEMCTGEGQQGPVVAEQPAAYEKPFPEPIQKAIEVLEKNPERAWELYALILERVEKK